MKYVDVFNSPVDNSKLWNLPPISVTTHSSRRTYKWAVLDRPRLRSQGKVLADCLCCECSRTYKGTVGGRGRFVFVCQLFDSTGLFYELSVGRLHKLYTYFVLILLFSNSSGNPKMTAGCCYLEISKYVCKCLLRYHPSVLLYQVFKSFFYRWSVWRLKLIWTVHLTSVPASQRILIISVRMTDPLVFGGKSAFLLWKSYAA